jgi:Uma2 family endonuclease
MIEAHDVSEGAMAATTKNKLLTAEEFMRLPDPLDGSQQELVRGEVITMPPPKGLHGICCAAITMLIGHFAKQKKLGYVTGNDAGTILERNPDTVRGPDVAFYSFKRVSKIPDGYFEVAPDLAIEVLSPDTSFSRLQRKVEQYLKCGSSLVWVFDPEVCTVTIYRPKQQPETLEHQETLSGENILPGFSCRVADCFE